MTLRKMINTKTGMVSVFDQLVLDERDWYKEHFDDEAQAPAPSVEVEADESAPAEEKKRKSLKQALQDKAEELQASDTVAVETEVKAE
jgi:hypothetical protein